MFTICIGPWDSAQSIGAQAWRQRQSEPPASIPKPAPPPMPAAFRQILNRGSLWGNRAGQIEAIKAVLSEGAMPAKRFHQLLDDAHVNKQGRYRLAREAGARKRKLPPFGPAGLWIWELQK